MPGTPKHLILMPVTLPEQLKPLSWHICSVLEQRLHLLFGRVRACLGWAVCLRIVSPCCHCAGNWWPSAERVADGLGRKTQNGSVWKVMVSILLDNFPFILFYILSLCRTDFLFHSRLHSKAKKIKINVLQC